GADLGSARSSAASDAAADVIRALLALGYNEREANAAVRGLPADTSVSDGIRYALKSLSK
ncbi:MAG TPA: RuvA C-terminal domain-containing protein, partial [Burkholderiaceae bacterium]|nr:RuvA C-terminal domain-containing protein [Burkholderiaceae bacterium]